MTRLILVIALFAAIAARRHHRKHQKRKQSAQDATAVEEMLMRLRGTFILNYVDQFDKFGIFNRSDPDINGDANRDSVQDYQPDSAGKRKRRFARRREIVNLTSSENEYKKALDKQILEASHLMMNDIYDPRDMNLFLTYPIELPVLCKKTLETEELIKLAQRASNFSFCWNNASDPENPQSHTYLEMDYLNPEQFQKFFKCASQKALQSGQEIDKQKYIDINDEKQMEYPEALFNFVMGRHLPGQPISWLRFALFICKEGGTFPENEYLLQPDEEGYSETVTDEYKEKIKKMKELAKSQVTKGKSLKMSGIIVSRLRFSQKKGRKLSKAKLITVDKVYQLKDFKKEKLQKASNKLDDIMRSIFDGARKKAKKAGHRLKNNQSGHHRHNKKY